MSKNVKSSYFIKIIFSFMDEKQKLKILKFNKYIQNIIDISITNYKSFTGKYIIIESEGIGKEYDGNDNRLIFEGEYLNGERNGKGKEYYFDGKIKFDGRYLNGKKMEQEKNMIMIID